MFTLYILLILISLLYFTIILSFAKGWDKLNLFTKGPNGPLSIFISVVIAYRNEEKNLRSLIDSLKKQSLHNKLFEIIFVNDYSSDNSVLLLNELTSGMEHVICTDLNHNFGKKQALNFGIKQAKGKLIVTTDADCTHHPDWLKTIYSFYLQKKPKLIVAPVVMVSSTPFEHYQALDFLSLIAASAGAIGINRPIMCNGANLAFEKSVFLQFSDPVNYKYASGDDIFLLHQFKKKYPKQIHYLKSESAVVKTRAEKTVLDFLHQRSRWASKSRGYTDKDTIITSIAVLTFNLSLLAGLFIAAFHPDLYKLLLTLFSLKLIIDLILICKVSRFLKQEKLVWYILPAQLINMINIPLVAFWGLLGKTNWKNETKS